MANIAKFFMYPWAVQGDRTTVPDTTQSDGSTSYENGYSFDYERAPTDTLVKYPERLEFNESLYQTQLAIKVLQMYGFPEFITPDQYGGAPFPYAINAFVRYDDGTGPDNYQSLKPNNTDLPSVVTSWRRLVNQTGFKTGNMIFHDDTVLPDGVATSQATQSGFIWPNGMTVGNANSHATGRANADTQALFVQIWTRFPNAIRQMVDSSGNPVANRGTSALADYNANYALPVRNMCEVTPAGFSLMGGATARGLLTDYRQGVDPTTFGFTGGEEKHAQTLDELVPHEHDQYYESNHNTGGSREVARGLNPGNEAERAGTLPMGGGQPFNIVQPTTICNFILKL